MFDLEESNMGFGLGYGSKHGGGSGGGYSNGFGYYGKAFNYSGYDFYEHIDGLGDGFAPEYCHGYDDDLHLM